MFKTKTFLLIFLFFFVFKFSAAQFQSGQIAELSSLFVKLRDNYDNGIKVKKIVKSVDSLYYLLLERRDFQDMNLSEIKKFSSILMSRDKSVTVVTWALGSDAAGYEYFGFIRYFDGRKVSVFRLRDRSDNIKNPQFAHLRPSRWYGCLYYELITVGRGKKVFYTLLGWDGNNLLSNRKIIEVLTIENGKPSFGYDFDIDGQKMERLIFEYNNQANMVLKFDENYKMIVWDHLSPSDAKYTGIYQFYGPDFSYDALIFKGGRWVYMSDVDVKNPPSDVDNKKGKITSDKLDMFK